MPVHIEQWRRILAAKGYYQESVEANGDHHFYKTEHDLNPLGIPVDADGNVSDMMCAILEYLLAMEEGGEIDPV